MANRKQCRAQAERIHTQTEINRRLNRASTLATYLPICIYHLPADMPMYWLPSVMDYLADDLRDVHDLFNGKKRNT